MGLSWLWLVLVVLVVVAGALRLAFRRPLLASRATSVSVVAVVVGVLATVALVFHCAAMFFTPWVAWVPGSSDAVAAVNAMGTASELAYWVPAAVLVIALRRVWWPALVGMTGCLLGVGVTMFWGFSLPTHLVWLSAAVLAVSAVFTGLVTLGGDSSRSGRSVGPPLPSDGPRAAV